MRWSATPACGTAIRRRFRPDCAASSVRKIVITAADRDLHSGYFGGAAANPIHILANILAGLHDETGRVTLDGFYDGVEETPTQIKAAWETLGMTTEKFLGEIGLSIPSGEKGRSVMELTWARPTAEVNGIWGGYTGEGFKTVIAAKASAKVSFRLVGAQNPDNDPREPSAPMSRSKIPADCSVEFHEHGGSPAIQLPYDSPVLTTAKNGPFRRVAEARGRHRHGRIDPDRRRFPEDAWHGIAAGRLRPVGRPYPFAEREIRAAVLPQGHPLLDPHPRRARRLILSNEDA